MSADHTPTPWSIHDETVITATTESVHPDHPTWIAETYADHAKADAAHIVRAVNAHDALVRSATDALAFLENDLQLAQRPSANPERLALIAALKLARGEA